MNFYKYMLCLREAKQDVYYGPFISSEAALDYAGDQRGCSEAILLRPHLWTKCPSASHDLLFMPIKGVVVRHGAINLIEVGSTSSGRSGVPEPSPAELRRLHQRRRDADHGGRSSYRRRRA
jgi:hypothetical protein